MNVVTVLGARPQFIKAAPVSWAMRESAIREILIHTGQHYDTLMSDVFFAELRLPQPSYHLGVGSGPHGRQTGEMLVAVEEVLLRERPEYVLVYGDTNSTLAGALAACKLGIRLGHVEAGLRSYNRAMPEEHNRVLTDHCSSDLFCPTLTAVQNLALEGLTRNVYQVGDTMLDAMRTLSRVADSESRVLTRLGLSPKGYLLATVHRAYNTDDAGALRAILAALKATKSVVVFPVHPRTSARLTESGLDVPSNVRAVDPVGYLDMLTLEASAELILTDSGGVQKEALFLGVPCITLRSETEWKETVDSGWNIVAGTDPTEVVSAMERLRGSPRKDVTHLFGTGDSAREIVRVLSSFS